jgi:hypothetical protein
MEVPEIVLLAVSEPIHEEMIKCPGAPISVHWPQLENQALESSMVVAITVMASSEAAGEK